MNTHIGTCGQVFRLARSLRSWSVIPLRFASTHLMFLFTTLKSIANIQPICQFFHQRIVLAHLDCKRLHDNFCKLMWSFLLVALSTNAYVTLTPTASLVVKTRIGACWKGFLYCACGEFTGVPFGGCFRHALVTSRKSSNSHATEKHGSGSMSSNQRPPTRFGNVSKMLRRGACVFRLDGVSNTWASRIHVISSMRWW